MVLTGLEKWQIFWISVNFYIHFVWECSLPFTFDYLQWKGGYSKFNALCASFFSYGQYDRRYCIKDATEYGSNIDKVVLAVEVPAGIIDGPLCILWLTGILNNTWYRHPAALTVSALHAFGTFVFWGDEIAPAWMSWWRGKGWKWTATDGPKSIHWWWAFVGTNLVWVVVPMMVASNALTSMKPALQAAIKHN